MENNNNNKKLGYVADIQYEENYLSDYHYIGSTDEENTGEIEYDDDFVENIQNNINTLTILIPGLIPEIQTIINQVFKPVLLDWRENFRDKKYPIRIPDPDEAIVAPIIPEPEPEPDDDDKDPDDEKDPDKDPDEDEDPEKDPDPDEDPEKDPDPDKDPDEEQDPDEDEDPDKDPDEEKDPDEDKEPEKDPDEDTDPEKDPDEEQDPEKDPDDKDPSDPSKDSPTINPIPNPWDPIQRPPGSLPGPFKDPGNPPSYVKPFTPEYEPDDNESSPFEFDDDDNLFTPATSKKFIYKSYDIPEIIKLEFDKNIMDLYDYYTATLKKIIGDYFAQLLTLSSYNVTNTDMDFLFQKITKEGANVSAELRHIMDSALRNEIVGNLKVSFSESMFSVESTLYHLKNMKAVHELRLRYAETERMPDDSKVESTANRILEGMREIYDAKYDNAYINLYKYLSSSLSVLMDVMRTILTCLKAKETIIKKGGNSK